MKLLLFCVESNKLKQIDWIYIESLIRHFFIEDRDVVRQPVFDRHDRVGVIEKSFFAARVLRAALVRKRL